ncbi:MAG: YciI family protein [Mycobacteriales bacterium]
MKYVILIYRNPASRRTWESLSATDRASGLQVYRELNAELAASGEYLASEALAYPQDGRQVWRREDGTISSDGPYAESKEHLAGFYLVDCASRERAAEIAGRVPEAGLGLVEVRPVLDLATLR